MKTGSTVLLVLLLLFLPTVSGAAHSSASSEEALLPESPTFLLSGKKSPSTAECLPDAETLCLLDGEVEIRVRFRNQRAGDREGTGQAIVLGERTGAFWFFREDNLELVVKALDGRDRNDHFWIFLGSLSDLEFWVDARATATGDSTTYYNPPGHLYGLADVNALGDEEGTLCGTFQGLTCPHGQFCDLEGGCNVADAAGTCEVVPEACTTVFLPVCGCDGVTYGNDCERLAAQVQKDHDGACEDGPEDP